MAARCFSFQMTAPRMLAAIVLVTLAMDLTIALAVWL